MVNFIKNSYNEFVHYVDRPKWSDIIINVRLVATFTVVLLILLYGVDSFFSSFLENFYSLLKKIKE
jgi:preprotein translocase subunit SecE